jgi:hypothetical protein
VVNLSLDYWTAIAFFFDYARYHFCTAEAALPDHELFEYWQDMSTKAREAGAALLLFLYTGDPGK